MCTIRNRRQCDLLISVVCLSICFFTGCGRKEERVYTQEEIARIFEDYNEKLGWDGDEKHRPDNVDAADGYSYDVREIAQQVDGFWKYYEIYQRQLEKLRGITEEWETDFIPAGEYEVGIDLIPGYYVLCNPDLDLAPGKWVSYDAEGTGLENGIKRRPNAGTYPEIYYYDAFFEIIHLSEGNIVNVKGNPKFAPLEYFPVLAPAEDGNYYGYEIMLYYNVGKDVPAGEYFLLSLDTSMGNLHLTYTGSNTLQAEARLYGKNRFSYISLEEGELFSMDKCVLIPIEQKPDISPISHEDIGYQNEDITLLELIIPKKKSGKTYEMLVYAEGEYIIGEDIPLGTYQIQNEITFSVSTMEETALQSDCEKLYDFSWTGLFLRDVFERGEPRWRFIRTGYNTKFMQIVKTDGTSEYRQIEKGSLPEVTFDESDAGYAVRLVRCILVPRNDE